MNRLLGYENLSKEIKEQILKVVDIWKKHVKDDLWGVYLHGSIALEAFNPESGDIDILVVVKNHLSTEEKIGIAKDIVSVDGRPRPLEMSAITVDEAKTWKNPGNCVFHYSDFWRERYLKRFEDPAAEVYVVDNEFGDQDVTSYIRLLKQCGIVLYGLPIAETFADVSDEDFFAAISNEVEDYEFDAYDPHYFASNILILGRILSFKKEKRILSKYEGGLWMAENVPEHLRHIPEKAMKVWFEGEEENFNPDELEELRQYLITEIKK